MPSSLAALLHGTFAAVGMWPARCACSCGQVGRGEQPAGVLVGASGRRPGSWRRSPRRPRRGTRGSRGPAPARCSWSSRGCGSSSVSSRLSSSHFLRPPSSSLTSCVAVELEVPVGVGGEPVVVAAVEHDGVVVARRRGSDSSASNCALLTKSRRTWSCRSVFQSSLMAPGCGPCRRRWCPRRPRRGRPSGRRGAPRPTRRRRARFRGSWGSFRDVC